MPTKLISLIRYHNFGTYPNSGLLMLTETKFKDGTSKLTILRRNYFSDEELEKQKEALEDLKNLPEEFSSEIEKLTILDEKIEIKVENRKIKIFKNYSGNEVDNVSDEENVQILKTNFSELFSEYEVDIIRNPEKEYSISVNNVL